MAISMVPTWKRWTDPLGRLKAQTKGRALLYPGAGSVVAIVCRKRNCSFSFALSVQFPPPTTDGVLPAALLAIFADVVFRRARARMVPELILVVARSKENRWR